MPEENSDGIFATFADMILCFCIVLILLVGFLAMNVNEKMSEAQASLPDQFAKLSKEANRLKLENTLLKRQLEDSNPENLNNFSLTTCSEFKSFSTFKKRREVSQIEELVEDATGLDLELYEEKFILALDKFSRTNSEDPVVHMGLALLIGDLSTGDRKYSPAYDGFGNFLSISGRQWSGLPLAERSELTRVLIEASGVNGVSSWKLRGELDKRALTEPQSSITLYAILLLFVSDLDN